MEGSDENVAAGIEAKVENARCLMLCELGACWVQGRCGGVALCERFACQESTV